MIKGICEICQQSRDSVKKIAGMVVCSQHISEEEWDNDNQIHGAGSNCSIEMCPECEKIDNN